MVLDTLSLAVNDEFHYPRFFQTMPYGPHGKEAISAGYFAAAMTMDPKPKTIAIAGADAEFSKNAMAGRARAHQEGGAADRLRPQLPAQHDRLQPDRARDQGDQPRLSYSSPPTRPTPPECMRAVQEQGVNAKMFGGPMVGLQYGSIKQQMGERINGVVDYELLCPRRDDELPWDGRLHQASTRRGRRRPAPTRSAITCRRWSTRHSRCWSRRSRV